MNVRTNTSNNTLNSTTSFLFVKPIITIVLLLIGHYFVVAQPNPMSDMLALHDAPNNKAESWSFLSGSQRVYYIDFDDLDFQLESVQLKNISGKVLFQDDVSDLSTFTLYELDFTKFESGEYFLELTTKNKALRKLLKLK